MTNDLPIHLRSYQNICVPKQHTEDSVIVPIWITQSSLDGLCMAIKYMDGLRDSGKGTSPGHFELVMFYRTLAECIRKANENPKKEEEKSGC